MWIEKKERRKKKTERSNEKKQNKTSRKTKLEEEEEDEWEKLRGEEIKVEREEYEGRERGERNLQNEITEQRIEIGDKGLFGRWILIFASQLVWGYFIPTG